MGMPVPGFNAGAPGIVGMVPVMPGTPEGIIVGGTLLVSDPAGIALVGAMPGTIPGIELVGVTPGTAPGIAAGSVLVAVPVTALVAPGIPGIAGTPADNPCSRERNAAPKNKVFFISGLSLACCNHRACKN